MLLGAAGGLRLRIPVFLHYSKVPIWSQSTSDSGVSAREMRESFILVLGKFVIISNKEKSCAYIIHKVWRKVVPREPTEIVALLRLGIMRYSIPFLTGKPHIHFQPPTRLASMHQMRKSQIFCFNSDSGFFPCF